MAEANEEPYGVNGGLEGAPINPPPQPAPSSIYTTAPVTVRIGGRPPEYQLLQAIVESYPGLKEKLTRDELFSSPSIDLPEVDEAVGHTLIHFLYTREYQILGLDDFPENLRTRTEFKKSVLAYCAARLCKIGALEEVTKSKIEELGHGLSVFDIQHVVEEVSPKLPQDTNWFSLQMGQWIKASLMNDHSLLRDNRLFDIIGRSPAFDRGVFKGLAEMFIERVDKVGPASKSTVGLPEDPKPVTDVATEKTLTNGTGPEDDAQEEGATPTGEPTEGQPLSSRTNGLHVLTDDANEGVAAAKAAAQAPEEFSPMPSDVPGSPFSPAESAPMRATISSDSNKATEASIHEKASVDHDSEVPAVESKTPKKKKKKNRRKSEAPAVQAVNVDD